MRRLVLFAVISVLSVGLLALFADNKTYADDLTPEQVAKVKANCVSIKNSLSQLHASDALLRVNRGQVYESMASKLMDTFNTRLATNNLDNKAMTAVSDQYRSQLNEFRVDYIAYEQKLSAAMKTDCESQPNTLHNLILEARELRTKVHADVLKLHRLIDDYRLSVGDFLLNYERLTQ